MMAAQPLILCLPPETQYCLKNESLTPNFVNGGAHKFDLNQLFSSSRPRSSGITPLAHFRGGLSCRFLRTRRDYNRNQGHAIQSGGRVRSRMLIVAAFLNWGEGHDSQSSCTAGGRKPGDLWMWGDASVATGSASVLRRPFRSLVSFSAQATSNLHQTGQEVDQKLNFQNKSNFTFETNYFEIQNNWIFCM